jgi:heptosyltransferase II
MNKIGIFLPNWIGDAVMATPALRALRRRHAAAEVVGIHRPAIGEVLEGTGLIDRSILYDRGDSRQRGLGLARQLRSERFDAVLLLTNSLRTAWMARLSGARRRIGYANDGRGWLLTDPLPGFDRKVVRSALDKYLELVEFLGCPAESKQTELATLSKDETQWAAFLCTLDEDLTRLPVVTLNPGGAFGEAKHWPAEHFAELARRIVDHYQKTVVVLCGPAERETAREIVRRADRRRVVSPADRTLSIGLSKAAVKHSELLITTDSGPRHFAQPFGTPVVTLFGPTHIGYSETYYEKGVHLQLKLDCGPCQKRTCPLGHLRCMTDLSVNRVFRAVQIQFDELRRWVA